jgi:hypothetical protein
MTDPRTWPPAERAKSTVVWCAVRPARMAILSPTNSSRRTTWAVFRPAASCGHADERSASRHSPSRCAHQPERDLYSAGALIADAGDAAGWRYVEFFTANIRNPHTRRAYARACARFFAWCEDRELTITVIRSHDVATWVEQLLINTGRRG